MGKKVREYERELWSLFWEYSRGGDFSTIRAYLLQRSGLPGPRGNLELATAFANVIQSGCSSGAFDRKALLSLCQSLCGIPAELAPTNDPNEYLVFCGVCGLGAVGTEEEGFPAAVSTLREMARDPRWRTREGVAMALQRLIESRPKQTLALLSDWAEEGDPLVLRAVAAGVAEPRLLHEGFVARAAIRLHEAIFERLKGMDRKGDDFKVLKKGLSYSLSVVVAASPKEGFALMARLVSWHDSDVYSVINENLTKKRLLKYPNEIRQLRRVLSVGGA
ncbi:MAG TPA: HEAT repeat domain-containing protein [Conexivisphaerales archaeon]|nr:HEAT repeat domain-containing protein [Conexivisphaerales archaeon]